MEQFAIISVKLHYVVICDKGGMNMSAELEGLLYYGVMVFVLLANILFAVLRMQNTRNIGKVLAQSIGLSFVLFSIASLWWFNFASDGFSQVFGGLFYGVAFIIGVFLNIGILFFMKKKVH